MATSAPSRVNIPSNLAFGCFGGQWAWRVEFWDATGKMQTRDFMQRDLHPGEAIASAKAFCASLSNSLAA